MIVVTRKDIELKERDESFELNACLEDYHIDSLNDYIANKLEDDDSIQKEDEPVFIIIHELCDNIDDIKKLTEKEFDVRAFVYISDKEKAVEAPKEDNLKKEEDEAPKDENLDVVDKKVSISAQIMSHFLDETNYQKYDCLDNVILHKINGWRVSSNKKGNEVIKYKDVSSICHELRAYIFAISQEWNLYDVNWQNDDIPKTYFPQTKLNDIEHYEIYNECLREMSCPNVSSILSAMIQQIASADLASTDNDDEMTDVESDEEYGVYRFGDRISQKNYLQRISKQQSEANKTVSNAFFNHFTSSLFKKDAIDQNVFDAQTTARYSFSELNPSVFDDALIYNAFNELYPQSEYEERVFREDMNKAEMMQCIQSLHSNPFIKCTSKCLEYMDAVLLKYEAKQDQQSCIDTFLCSNIGFRKWLNLPSQLKDSKPKQFFPALNDAQFFYNNTLSLPQSDWCMGLTSFDYEENKKTNKPYLWLRDNQNSVISISKDPKNEDSINFSVHFPDDAQLSFTSKPIVQEIVKEEEAVADDAENVDEVEAKNEELATPQTMKNDVVSISLPNEVTIEYHSQSGQLIIYHQSALNRYYKLKHIKSDEKEKPADSDESPKASEVAPPKVDADKVADDGNENEEKNKVEPEPVDVSWDNNDSDIFEVWRVINKEGVISIHYSNGGQRKLFPNSETWIKASEDSAWIKIKSNGECTVAEETKKALLIVTNTDSESSTKVKFS